MIKANLFTSESVSEGHPDKVADLIADTLLDEYLKQDPESHIAIECFLSEEYVLIGGEVTSKAKVDYEPIVRNILRNIGYTSADKGIGCDTCKIEIRVKEQSPDISMGVVRGDNILDMGAGDQGFMFGYATNESEGYMPLPITLSHKLVRTATNLRKAGKFKGARPDMKSQVTIDYTDPKHPTIYKILMSVQHDPDIDMDSFKKYIHDEIMVPVAKSFNLNIDFEYLVNPTGRFVIGGPLGDTGLTGRKLVVDTYGGVCRHGGGAMSGKDPSKVDRSGAYYARYMAKNLVAAGIADRLEVQLAYAIGVATPMSVSISTFGTAHYPDEEIYEVIRKFFDARPGAIIKKFNLKTPSFKYADTTNYGAFGRPDLTVPWEALDIVDDIKAYLAK